MKSLMSLAALFEVPGGVPQTPAGSNFVVDILLPLFFGALGAVAVLIITMAGFQYVISQGDPQKISKAKDTILYAVIGLALSIGGYAIVRFVVGKLVP